MPECDLRPLQSISQISQGNADKGQGQAEQENIRQGLRPAASKQTWNFALFNGKAGNNENDDPASKGQQGQRPGDEQQPDRYWNLNERGQAADPGRNQARVEQAADHDPPDNPEHDDGAGSDKQNVRQSTEKIFRRRH